ncbi:MAG: hypothetical protein ACI9MU_001619, partial [Alphaproteobacteria bacterium]
GDLYTHLLSFLVPAPDLADHLIRRRPIFPTGCIRKACFVTLEI